jgi:hypothetical protein
MATGGQIGSGIKAGYSTNSGSTWTQITAILEGDPPQFERDDVETTVHGTTSVRTKIPGLSDVSDARLLLLADFDRGTSPSHLALKDLESAQTTITFRYEIPVDADLSTTTYFVYQYSARVGSWKPSTPIDDKKTIEVTFKFATGSITTSENQASAF